MRLTQGARWTSPAAKAEEGKRLAELLLQMEQGPGVTLRGQLAVLLLLAWGSDSTPITVSFNPAAVYFKHTHCACSHPLLGLSHTEENGLGDKALGWNSGEQGSTQTSVTAIPW